MFLLENSSNINKNEFIILSKYNQKYFEKADAIIPFGIKSQKILNQYEEFKQNIWLTQNMYIIIWIIKYYFIKLYKSMTF